VKGDIVYKANRVYRYNMGNEMRIKGKVRMIYLPSRCSGSAQRVSLNDKKVTEQRPLTLLPLLSPDPRLASRSV